MKGLAYDVFLIVIVSLSGCAADTDVFSVSQDIPCEVENTPSRDDMKLALCLRNKVYSRSNFVDDSHPFGEPDDWSRPDIMLDRAYTTNEGHLCGGRALLYLRELQKVGITARYAGILERANDSCIYTDRSHASAEVFINGKWIALDPHFNISFRDEQDQMLSWKDIYQISSLGKEVIFDTDGYSQGSVLNSRSLQHSHPFKEVAKFLVVGPSKITKEVELYPSSWDGVISYRSCNRPDYHIDVSDSDAEYSKLEAFDLKASIESLTYMSLAE